jgi:hypothetical protein
MDTDSYYLPNKSRTSGSYPGVETINATGLTKTAMDLPAKRASAHGRWNIPLVTDVEGLPEMAMEVHATVVQQPTLSLSPYTAAFDQVALGQSKVMNVHIVHHFSEPIGSFSTFEETLQKNKNANQQDTPIQAWSMQSLNATGPFSILNALRPIDPYLGGSTVGKKIDKNAICYRIILLNI